MADVHRAYIDAGAQIIETNTFGANRYKLAGHGLETKVRRINAAAVSALASNILLCLVGLYFARKQAKIDIRELLKWAFKTLWPALIMGVAVYLLSFKINFILTIPIGAAVYFILLFINGSITMDNVNAVRFKFFKRPNVI